MVLESLLTGEGEPVEKVAQAEYGGRTNMAYMITSVSKGRAKGEFCYFSIWRVWSFYSYSKGIVVATGVNTEAGKLSANLFSAEEPITPLRKKLNMLGKILVITACMLTNFLPFFIVFCLSKFQCL